MKRFLAGFISALFLIAAAAAAFLFSGAFDVAATRPHTAFGRWVLATTTHISITRRGADISAPDHFTPEQVQEGFSQFNAMCVTCHGAPGKERDEIGKGLNPRGPDLADSARHWDAAHLFWIVKNGIRMTGMPAFGPTHSDEDIWSIVAFVEQLPNMTAQQYANLEKSARKSGGHPH